MKHLYGFNDPIDIIDIVKDSIDDFDGDLSVCVRKFWNHYPASKNGSKFCKFFEAKLSHRSYPEKSWGRAMDELSKEISVTEETLKFLHLVKSNFSRISSSIGNCSISDDSYSGVHSWRILVGSHNDPSCIYAPSASDFEKWVDVVGVVSPSNFYLDGSALKPTEILKLFHKSPQLCIYSTSKGVDRRSISKAIGLDTSNDPRIFFEIGQPVEDDGFISGFKDGTAMMEKSSETIFEYESQ